MEPNSVPLNYDSDAAIEELLALREAEHPGFRAEWEAARAARAATEEAEDQRARLADQEGLKRLKMLGQSMTRKTKAGDLIPEKAAIAAFTTCLEPPDFVMPDLFSVAKRYRERLEEEAREGKSSITPAQLVGGLGAVHDAALALAHALRNLPTDGWRELEIGGAIARNLNRADVLQAARDSEVWDTDAWTRRLQGLRAYTKWLRDEVDKGIPKQHHTVAQASREPADDKLHRDLLEIFRACKINERWLKHVARTVRAWALGVGYQDVEPNWGKAARTAARQWWSGMDEAMTQCAQRIVAIHN